MHKKFLFRILGLASILAVTTFSMQAFSTSKYATTSKLANGKWVKIAIPENGMYQLTYAELAQMGFSNPESVRIYGAGGHPLNELLDGNAIDDLQQVPAKHYGEKICFYANGPIKYTLATPTSVPHYTRDFNSYSQLGYYFITSDDGSQQLEPTAINYDNVGIIKLETSLNYSHYEKELYSAGQSGKDLLGEPMPNASLDLEYSMPGLCGDSMVVVNTCAAAKVTSSSYVAAKLNGNEINYTLGSSKIYAPATTNVYYNYASPYASFTPNEGETIPQNGTLNVNIYNPNGSTNWARLDYYILTYFHNNTLVNAADNQLRMGYSMLTTSDRIAVAGDTNTQVWNIDNPQAPKAYNLTAVNDTMEFTPGISATWAQFIAFDPSKDLKSIASYEEVANQNIHGMSTPDMVIVTCEKLMPQAERIAQMHRDNDNMTVHVIDQQDIFNEFSSGTPDGMAIRLMNKMFYDRNSSKFKNLLMFGAGTYDNRHLLANYDCTILTYEATTSNDEDYSYVNDDFFGILDDNSGREPASEYLRLGVGRIPSASLSEAQDDVDKLINYVSNPDYGAWRNDALFIADDYDNGLHSFQTEGINNIVVDELATGLMNNKVYVSQFPKESGFALEARKSMTAQLKNGQYFMDYVGHAGPTAITKGYKLWTINEAKTVSYPYLPIFLTACCDVARYDSNQRGIMEAMFHKKDGGAIALVTSTRAAYATNNDALNQAFTRAMFSYGTKGYMPTLGEAYMNCKQSFGKSVNYNKMMFVLLGDPAIKINYPKPFFKITKVNDTEVGDSNIPSGPMKKVTVEAMVYNPDGTTVNTNFNGDATLSIYDILKLETTNTQRVNRVDVTRDIYYPRQLLTRVNGRVENGVFTASAIIPRYILSTGSTGSIKVYAHQDDSDEMVNGSFDKLMLNVYNEADATTIIDNQPPVIESIYFNDEQEFASGAIIPANSTLYIRATDDYAFNNQSQSIGNGMKLVLDGGKTSYPYVKNYSTLNDEGKSLAVTFPMELQEGQHLLQYTVYDAAGNAATRTISFMVGNNSQVELSVEEEPAVEEATINATTTLAAIPPITLKVLDTVGNVVWSTTSSEFPVKWDLKDNSGNKVPAGIYKFYGTYNNGNNYGGTNIGHVIVIEPYKTSE